MTFPTAPEVTSNASSTATPAPINEEKVLVKRATTILLISTPIPGTFMINSCHQCLPLGVLIMYLKTSTAVIIATIIKYQNLTKKSLIASIATVSPGKELSSPLSSVTIDPI